MANPEHVEIVRQGARAVADWREAHPKDQLNLAQVDLSRAKLSNANLSCANLRNAILAVADLACANLGRASLADADCVNADLSEADLGGANLSGANLRRASLSDANLAGANLAGANLTDARLMGANLSGAELRNADLSNAVAYGTSFDDLNLSEVIGLDSIVHRGPSTVGVDTLYRWQGEIPESFLQGCGVPVGLIDYLPSLLGMQKALEFYSCFISYSHKDEEFSKRLHSRMRDEHLRVWYAREDMAAGKKLNEQIDRAIRLHDKLLVVLSKHSTSSEWVKTEVRKARKREVKEGKRVLFPIRLVSFDAIRDWEAFDADTGKDMAAELREYFIPDFSNWKDHDEFEKSFQRLLNDLQAEADDEE